MSERRSDTRNFYTLDVFTNQRFGGNQLAVLPDAEGLTTEQMQAITREFNLSETVFVLPPDDPTHLARVRIFTPGRELPFAGHPTVGTAFLLAALGRAKGDSDELHIVLGEGVGPVPVTITMRNGTPVSAELTAAKPPEIRDEAPPVDAIARMLSLEPADVVYDTLRPQPVSCGVPFLLVPLRDQAAVSRARLNAIAFDEALRGAWARETYLFDASAARAGAEIRARMFAPDLGIGEDPATGSAAASLAGYLQRTSALARGPSRKASR